MEFRSGLGNFVENIMVKRVVAIVALSVYVLTFYGQLPRSQGTAAYLSASHYDPAMVTALSFGENPAALAAGKGFGAGMYHEKRYMLEGLNLFTVAGLYALDKSAGGISFRYFGGAAYNEVSLLLSYGRSLGRVNLGISISYEALNIGGSEKRSSVDASISSVWKLSDDCYASMQVVNLGLLKEKSLSRASMYKLGFGYRASSKINAGIEFVKEEYRPPEFLFSIHYHFEQKYFARAGFLSGSAELFAGVGWIWKDIRMEILAKQHSRLGITPGILLIYQNRKK